MTVITKKLEPTHEMYLNAIEKLASKDEALLEPTHEMYLNIVPSFSSTKVIA